MISTPEKVMGGGKLAVEEDVSGEDVRDLRSEKRKEELEIFMGESSSSGESGRLANFLKHLFRRMFRVEGRFVGISWISQAIMARIWRLTLTGKSSLEERME